MNGLSAFATGATFIANINTLRKSNASVALVKPFSISTKHFCNEIMPLPNYKSSRRYKIWHASVLNFFYLLSAQYCLFAG